MTTTTSKWLKRLLWTTVLAAIAIGVMLAYAIQHAGIPPRAVAPYVERRAAGHHPFIGSAGTWVAQTLTTLDRGQAQPYRWRPTLIGAQAGAAPAAYAVTAGGNVVLVASADQAAQAIAQARPGDVVTFLPGTYRFSGRNIKAARPGNSDLPITVRAERAGTVFLEFSMVEGFTVSAPYWTFENLNIRGVCSDHADCEHAFHVVARAAHFIARNNTITDFNAHFKINGDGKNMPDDGLIDGNTLTNASVRRTHNPVALIDLVAASRWIIRRNLIADFDKGEGNHVSYGAFVKGAGADNRLEQNVVLCEHLLRDVPGQRVGLSLGGGGTGKEFCRDHRCITEQDGGVIQSNLIASCSDDGIYVNRSATSKILNNTLIDTGGITVRFVESSADVEGNLVDGAIRSRDGGVLRAVDNRDSSTISLYLGRHPARALFAEAGQLNFAWNGEPPRRNASNASNAIPPDLCGAPRATQPVYGAFENFSACLLAGSANK